MVESAIDSQVQTQMCGVELTLQRIERFIAAGALVAERAARGREPRDRVLEILGRAVDQAAALGEGTP